MKATQGILDKILSIVTQGEDSPFIQEDGTNYIKFDGFTISSPDKGQTIRVAFTWMGEETYYSDFRASLKYGDILTLRGFEGRSEHTLTPT